MTTIDPIKLPKPDYAFVYANFVRHVAAADALLTGNRVYEAAKELQFAMETIAMFEKTSMTITIKTDDN